MIRQLHLLLIVGILFSATLGCGDGRPQTYPTSGIVRFEDGNPVRMGFISLLPVEGGPSARGKLNTNGQFTLGTFENDDGVTEGDHIVIITQPTPPVDPKKARTLGQAHQEHANSKYLVSRKYASRETTDLQATISSTEKNFLELTVKSIDESEFRQRIKQQQK